MSQLSQKKIPGKSSLYHLKKIFDGKILTDVVIKTNDGKEILCHKVILIRSSVFDRMLHGVDMKEAKEGIIEITDFNHEVVLEMIRYLYYDVIPNKYEIVLELLKAADKYDIPGLLKECEKFLIAALGMENFAEILIIADVIEDAKNLKIKTIDFIMQ